MSSPKMASSSSLPRTQAMMADAALAWEALLTHWRPHGSDRLLFTAGTCFILEVTFLSGCVVFWLLDALPALFRPWQATFPKAKPQPPAALLREAWTDHFLSTFIVRPILVWLLYPAFTYCGMRIETAALPTAAAACRQLVLCILIDDTWFYWSHRWLHENRWLYGKVHKQHHRFTATTPVASEFAHPFEDLVSNTGSTVAGPLLLGSHLAIVWVYSFVKLSQTIQVRRMESGTLISTADSWLCLPICMSPCSPPNLFLIRSFARSLAYSFVDSH